MSKVKFYVVIEDRRRYNSSPPDLHAVGVRTNKPRLERNEVAVKVNLTIDDAVFAEFVPTVEAEIGRENVIVASEIELLEADGS